MKVVPVVFEGVLQKVLLRSISQIFTYSGVVMIASAQTEIFDLQGAVIFKLCSAYPATQPPPSLPPSLPQGVGEIGNKKTGTKEIQVILLGGV